jgi:hypothetical protein
MIFDKWNFHVDLPPISGGLRITIHPGLGLVWRPLFLHQWRPIIDKFPDLAMFHFLIWQGFTSRFGAISLPDLAPFYFPVWQAWAQLCAPTSHHASRVTCHDSSASRVTCHDSSASRVTRHDSSASRVTRHDSPPRHSSLVTCHSQQRHPMPPNHRLQPPAGRPQILLPPNIPHPV